MAQVYDYNSEKKEFKVMYSFEMHDFLSPCSQLNKNFKQIDYAKSGLSTHTMLAMLSL